MAVKVTIENNVGVFKNALPPQIERALTEIGLVAEGYAKDLCPADTGRLRNSITFTVDGQSTYIGTNVEYATFVEMGTTRMAPRPYIKPAALNHTAEYKEIAKKNMQS